MGEDEVPFSASTSFSIFRFFFDSFFDFFFFEVEDDGVSFIADDGTGTGSIFLFPVLTMQSMSALVGGGEVLLGDVGLYTLSLPLSRGRGTVDARVD